MHEASLMTGLIRRIETVARENGGRRVAALKVRLGALSHFSPEHFREHFVPASVGTLAEGATLTIEVSGDPTDPHAMDVLLEHIDVEP